MDEASRHTLQQLLRLQPIGALGTLRGVVAHQPHSDPASDRRSGRQGDRDATAEVEPFVSMVPVAWLPGRVPVLHVSQLAAHTRDLQLNARASLMLTAPLAEGDDPQALPRLTLQADAQFLVPGSADANAARAAYLQRFPRAEQTFALGDFRLLRLQPRQARFIAGFGRAFALSVAALAAF